MIIRNPNNLIDVYFHRAVIFGCLFLILNTMSSGIILFATGLCFGLTIINTILFITRLFFSNSKK